MDLYRRFFQHTVATGQRARLRVENRNGLIYVRSHDLAEVAVNVSAELYASSSAEADHEMERLRRAIRGEGGTVEIITPDLPRPEFVFFGRGSKVDYDIFVPRSAEVDLSSRNGRIELRAVEGPVSVRSRNGPITIEEVDQEVQAQATNGRVTVRRCRSTVTARSSNGQVTIEGVQGDISIDTRNGSVDVREASAAVRAVSTNGALRIAGLVNADFDLQTTNGGVRLAVPAQARFEIDAESRRGSVRSELPVREGAADGPRPRVRIRTTNGSIRISVL